MIDLHSSNKMLIDFLSKYPESMRRLCAEAVIVYGVRTIKNKFPYGLSANQLISVSGIGDVEDPHSRIISSCNISIANNRSLDFNRFVNEGQSKSDEKTDRYPDLSKELWPKAERKVLNRIESEQKFSFSTQIKVPETCPYETAKGFFSRKKNDEFQRENEVMKIADEFLKNSYASYLSAQTDSDSKKNSRSFNKKK